MSIVQRLLDTAQMRTQYPEWLCKEMEAAAEEITKLRKAMTDVRWRVLDTRETLMRENMVGGDRLYNCDEWSTPTVNLQRAADAIDAAMNGANG